MGTYIIPHGVTVTLINDRSNSGSKTITLSKDKMHGQEGFRVGGVLAQYSSVKVEAPINSFGIPMYK